MSSEPDFVFIDFAAIAKRTVTICDEKGVRPDPDWHREAMESEFVFVEFLVEHGLIDDGQRIERKPDLVIRWSQLSAEGKRFSRSEYDKWLRTIDKTGLSEATKREKLRRRWHKYCTKRD